jgi:hypothetical protein
MRGVRQVQQIVDEHGVALDDATVTGARSVDSSTS